MKSILCIGDSHTRLIGIKSADVGFRYGRICPTEIKGFDQAQIFSIKGATATGFRPKSEKPSSFARTRRAINQMNPSFVCFGFGQVDAELSCYFDALRSGIPLDDAIRIKKRQVHRYLLFCQRSAGERPFVIKGLNPVALQNNHAFRRMLLGNLPAALEISAPDVSHWLDRNSVTLETHYKINSEIAEELNRAAKLLSLAYFDLREELSTGGKLAVAKPDLCGPATNVHLRLIPTIEKRFGDALWETVKSLQ